MKELKDNVKASFIQESQIEDLAVATVGSADHHAGKTMATKLKCS